MNLVRVSSLVTGDVFRTIHTGRVGSVLGPRARGGIRVFLEPIDDQFKVKDEPPDTDELLDDDDRDRGEFEEKVLACDIWVRIDGVDMPELFDAERSRT